MTVCPIAVNIFKTVIFLVKRIEGASNALIKQTKKLKEKKYRLKEGLFIAEGENLCRELFNHKPELVKTVFVTENYLNENPVDNFDVVIVPDFIFESLCETKTPQGIAAVASFGEAASVGFIGDSLVVYLDNVKDPGNVGTIIRTADAAGFDAVVLSKECADIYNSKTLRATMGSVFHIHVFYEEEYLSVLKKLKESGFNIFAGCLDAKTCIFDENLKGKSVICIGNEAHGISGELINLGVNKTKIPIPGQAESLNAAVAGAIMMYEAVRQRGTL